MMLRTFDSLNYIMFLHNKANNLCNFIMYDALLFYTI